MELNLTNSRAIITAASKGLGRAVAHELVSEGATVAICSRNEKNLEAARETILAETGAAEDAVRTYICDLRDTDAIEATLDVAITDLGDLDILVTNHGGPPVQPIAETSITELDDAYNLILKSTFVTLKQCLPELADDGGSVINIVSATVREPLPADVLQNLLRPGIYALSTSLAREYGPDVRVNCVCPRGITTERLQHKIELLSDREGITTEEAAAHRADELAVG